MSSGAQGARKAIRRRLGAVVAVLTASGVLALAAPGIAHAAPPSCAGMRKIRTLTFDSGAVRIHKSGGWMCAITVQNNPGTERRIAVGLQSRGHVAVNKARRHTRSSPWARVYAGHSCVRVTAAVAHDEYSSGWIFC
ncbi:hypothetical protein [Streptomyces sp. NPDC096132]|uniref:hypothetical protein n=1 Tax=Streptomyces sp. NPDC096132 TaxID=3366075 RepID=UPI0037FF35A1